MVVWKEGTTPVSAAVHAIAVGQGREVIVALLIPVITTVSRPWDCWGDLLDAAIVEVLVVVDVVVLVVT